MEEEKMGYEAMKDLMEKIAKEMERTRQRQEKIDTLTQEWRNEVRPVVVKEKEEELENAKKEKAEFDEMTKNALMNVEKGIVALREESEKEFNKKLMEITTKENHMKAQLLERDPSPAIADKILKVKESATRNRSKLKAEQAKLREELKGQEGLVWEYADEIGVAEELQKEGLDRPLRPEPKIEEQPEPIPQPKKETLETNKMAVDENTTVTNPNNETKQESDLTSEERKKQEEAMWEQYEQEKAANGAKEKATIEKQMDEMYREKEAAEALEEQQIAEDTKREIEEYDASLLKGSSKKEPEPDLASEERKEQEEAMWKQYEQKKAAKEAKEKETIEKQIDEAYMEKNLKEALEEQKIEEDTKREIEEYDASLLKGSSKKEPEPKKEIQKIIVNTFLDQVLTDFTFVNNEEKGSFTYKRDGLDYRDFRAGLVVGRIKKEKYSNGLDPNIEEVLEKENPEVLKKYRESLQNGTPLPFELEYNLKHIRRMMPNEERKNIKKIIRAVEDIEGVTIQPETLRHKLKGFYHALKAKFISDEPKKLEEDNIQANQKREAEKTAKTERKQHFTSKKLPKAIKENAKTFRISLTRFSGYVRGENPLVTQAKINKIQNANFVPKVKVNEQAALKKASSTPKEQDTPIK